MVSWSLWPAAAFPSSSRSRSRCLPLKLVEPAVAAAVRSQWLPSSSSQRASSGCCHLLANSMSTVAAIPSLSPSHANLVLQDLCRIERLQARGNQQAYMTGGNLYLIFLWCMVNKSEDMRPASIFRSTDFIVRRPYSVDSKLFLCAGLHLFLEA
ncbi:hypothetical protein EE612_056275 [Oryza sativa]|nr:hypothetical protein EE612_056275 [Oryza sativa]